MQIAIIPRNTTSRRVVEKLAVRDEGIAQRYLEINGARRPTSAGRHRSSRRGPPAYVILRSARRSPRRDGELLDDPPWRGDDRDLHVLGRCSSSPGSRSRSSTCTASRSRSSPATAPAAGSSRSSSVRDEGVAERYLEINGVWEDHVRYAITAEEWDERRDELLKGVARSRRLDGSSG